MHDISIPLERENQAYRFERVAFNLVTSRNQKARRKLLKKNITPRTLPMCKSSELAQLGFNEDEIKAIRGDYIELAQEELEKARQNDIQVIFKEDEHYPACLAEIYDPPDFIYARGDLALLETPKLAIVGSRKGSSYGRWCLDRFLPDLCRAGLTIVSGMAYGIDSMAHSITLREQGNTIGVNAGGLLNLYPTGNTGMIRQILEKGLIISEFSLDIVPRPFYFPIRNRIIAGISQAIMVVEAALRSGSLITARLGLEQNRDILAVPGRIDSPISQGTNYLIQQGAKPVTSARDILDEFDIQLETDQPETNLEFTRNETQVLEMLGDSEIRSIDYFAGRIELSVSTIISTLMGLVLKNVVIEEGGGYRRIY